MFHLFFRKGLIKLKLPNGFGTVYKLRGKRRRPFVVKETVNGKQKALGYFTEFDEAMTFLINYNHNPTLFSSKTTFKEIYERWKTQKFDKISASSISGYEISYKHCKLLHKMAFRDIRYGHLEQVINNVRQAGAGYATQKKVRVLLEQLYAYASKYDLVERDYARFLEIDKHVAVYKKKPFSVRERNRLWKNRDVECVDDILILIYSGLRLGEYLSLTSQDINKRGRYLHVRKSKTPSGVRIVPINKKIWPIVEQRIKEYHICPYRTVDELASHKHAIFSGYGESQTGTSDAYRYQKWAIDDLDWHADNTSRSLGSTGGDKPHSNLQPSYSCYLWKRVS